MLAISVKSLFVFKISLVLTLISSKIVTEDIISARVSQCYCKAAWISLKYSICPSNSGTIAENISMELPLNSGSLE